MEAALQLRGGETGLLENLRVRQEIHPGPGLFCLAQLRQQAVLQFNDRNSPLIPVVVDVPLPADLNIQVGGEGVYHRGTYPVKAAAGFIGIVVKLSPGVKSGKDQPLRRHPFFVHAYGDPPAVVLHRAGAVGLQHHFNM